MQQVITSTVGEVYWRIWEITGEDYWRLREITGDHGRIQHINVYSLQRNNSPVCFTS